MKFQIVFLSLLVTAHARYEPKGLRGGDDRDLELDTLQINHIIPEGGSAKIHCGSRSTSQCCVATSFKVVDDTGPSEWGSGDSCNDGFTSMTDGMASVCQMEACTISCDSPSCRVDVEAGGSDGRGGGFGKLCVPSFCSRSCTDHLFTF